MHALVIDWCLESVPLLVAAISEMKDAPSWLRTRPPHVTYSSFADDVVTRLDQQAAPGTRFRKIILTPLSLEQFNGVNEVLIAIQSDPFLQEAARRAFPASVDGGVERVLATTYHMLDTRTQITERNNLPPPRAEGEADPPLRRLFL